MFHLILQLSTGIDSSPSLSAWFTRKQSPSTIEHSPSASEGGMANIWCFNGHQWTITQQSIDRQFTIKHQLSVEYQPSLAIMNNQPRSVDDGSALAINSMLLTKIDHRWILITPKEEIKALLIYNIALQHCSSAAGLPIKHIQAQLNCHGPIRLAIMINQ